jgi:NAD(P)-dependent dehydrogenase (short-subunit alcohol dehydrogenase family)
MSKTFLSIGSGPGIGLATATRFAREGYRIVLSSRNMQRLRRQAEVLGISGASVMLQEADASRPAQIVDLVARNAGEGELVLHYNAGVLHYDEQAVLMAQPIERQPAAELVSDLQVNLASAMAAVKAALPAMRAAGKGSILLTGGGFGVHPSADFLGLSIGKAGLRAMAQALFEPLRQSGIHIATVTVSQLVSPGSDAARAIAEQFWQMHAAPKEAWEWETVFG